MKRSTKLKQLETKLKYYVEKIRYFDKRKISGEGGVDFGIVMEAQKLETEKYYTQKQIDFLKQGKSHLGQEIGSKNINPHLK